MQKVLHLLLLFSLLRRLDKEVGCETHTLTPVRLSMVIDFKFMHICVPIMEPPRKKLKRFHPQQEGDRFSSAFDKLPQEDNCCSCLQMIMAYFDLKTLGRFLQTSILKKFDHLDSNGTKVNIIRDGFCNALFRSLKMNRIQELNKKYELNCYHEAFITACKEGNLQDVRSYVYTRTCSCEECLEDLINYPGFDEDVDPDECVSSPIASALAAKQENVARYLLTFTDNIDLSYVNYDDQNILHLAVLSMYYYNIFQSKIIFYY